MQILVGHSRQVSSVTFSYNSELIASGSGDQMARVWRVDTGECVQTLEGHSHPVRLVTFSYNSELIASGSDDNTIRIWRASTGECEQTLNVGFRSFRLFFGESNGSRLLTDYGAIALQVKILEHSSIGSLANDAPACRSSLGISKDKSWVIWNEERLLWLPKEYQPSASAVSGPNLAVGCSSGRVMIIGFSLHHVSEIFTERKS